MRAAVLALGVMLLFVGAIVFSESNRTVVLPPQVTTLSEKTELPLGEWQIAADFPENVHLIAEFAPPGEDVVYPNGDMLFDVDVVDPEGGNTSFRVAFSPGGDIDVNVTANDGGLTATEPLTQVIGTTTYEGSYGAHVYTDPIMAGFYYPPNGTLPYLQLRQMIERSERPNVSYMPVGAGLLVAGAVLSIWGARASRPSLKPRKTRGE